MSTLELIWDAHTTYKLWSWTNGNVHYGARLIRRLDGRDNICTVRISAGALPRSNTDTDADVAVIKMAWTPDGTEALEREAQFYDAHMGQLQGRVVPRCLGHFRGKVAGKQMSCLVLEYCPPVPEKHIHDPHQKIMSAMYEIHDSGVMHGEALDGRHFIKNGRKMMIVDFSSAVAHQCVHGREVRGHDGRRHVGVCSELKALERIYGVYRR
ncbi:hypothetical protein FB45DRAFT_928201 [Roridomyces roridus]|uniref:Protein kinase domain-containing protein n=1 Tax=Roridomyces roridus TaxID=1738132 RepID=A0AAD7FFE0_9AGAR|nr:hypothetical protein FB45DRAFT_928201 [Roridomyces roridus]